MSRILYKKKVFQLILCFSGIQRSKTQDYYKRWILNNNNLENKLKIALKNLKLLEDKRRFLNVLKPNQML